MKIEIENTDKIVEVSGVPARVWEGKTSSGIPVHCFVTRIIPQTNKDIEVFEQELMQTRVPSPEILAYPMRLAL